MLAKLGLKTHVVAAVAAFACITPAQAQSKFTVANGGPSGLAGANIYRTVAGLPLIAWPAAGLGCTNPADDINGISARKTFMDFVACGSVDPTSVGSFQGPTPIGLPPFNVFDQAQKNQHAGDLFLLSKAFSRNTGVIPAASIPANQTYLNANQAAPYSKFLGLLPAGGPAVAFPNLTPMDDVDGVVQEPGVMPVYFSLTAASPSLPTLAGPNPSGADILFDPDPLLGGNESVFAKASALGLLAGDQLDAVVVFDDNANGVFDQVDTVIFSLARFSPSLALIPATAADLLVVTNGTDATVNIFAPDDEYGLSGADNLDHVDIFELVNQSAYETIQGIIGDYHTSTHYNGPVASHLHKGSQKNDASVVQTGLGLGTFGFGNAGNDGFRVADDFTVGPDEPWMVTGFTFQGFFLSQIINPSPFQEYVVGIWSGPPVKDGSPDVMPYTAFKLSGANKLTTTFASLYRVSATDINAMNRPVFNNRCTLATPLLLKPGTYWIDWQATGDQAFSGPLVPPVTLLNQLNKPGSNAMQFIPFIEQWQPVLDGGLAKVPHDLPFEIHIVRDIEPPAFCYADCDANNTLNVDDFICYQTAFALGEPYADCDADGVLSISDFICFQTGFAIGC